MNRQGMSLLEVMFAVAILTVVMGALFTLGNSLGDTAQVQEALVTAQEEARKGLNLIVRDLRQSASFSMSALPTDTLTYQVATDLDGNGTAVDVASGLS